MARLARATAASAWGGGAGDTLAEDAPSVFLAAPRTAPPRRHTTPIPPETPPRPAPLPVRGVAGRAPPRGRGVRSPRSRLQKPTMPAHGAGRFHGRTEGGSAGPPPPRSDGGGREKRRAGPALGRCSQGTGVSAPQRAPGPMFAVPNSQQTQQTHQYPAAWPSARGSLPAM